ncbi:MAG: LysM peptidoglycan-binding domain-containing protein [Syntrophales bacterium]|nr:LysM peptidoglycan-binding domain-containing protein [Syntrophales bacterium]
MKKKVIFLFGVGLFFYTALYGYAREETVRLVFRKHGSYKGHTYVYTVRKGDWLLDILRKRGLGRSELRLVKMLNPHVRDLNRIYPGQKIVLPGKRVAKAGLVSRTEGGQGSSKGTLGEDVTKVWSRTDVDLIRGILKRFDVPLSTAGHTYIPMPDGGHVVVDCSFIPRIDFDDGTTVFLDYNGRLPIGIGELVEKTWPNYRVLRPAQGERVLSFLSRILSVTRSYEMMRVKGLLSIGEKEYLQFSGDWIIKRKTPAGGPHTQIIVNVASEENLLPLAFHEYARRKGVLITEIMKDKITDRPSEVSHSLSEIPSIKGNSAQEIIRELLKVLGYPVFQKVPLRFFDKAKDGFQLALEAELMTEKNGTRIIVSSKPLQESLVDVLRMHGIVSVSLKEGESTRFQMEKVLQALGESYTVAYYSLPVYNGTSSRQLRIVLPCMRILKKNANPIYLIDFDLDPVIYDYLHKKMGLTILRY